MKNLKSTLLIFSLTAGAAPVIAQSIGHSENSDQSRVVHKYTADLNNLKQELGNSSIIDFDMMISERAAYPVTVDFCMHNDELIQLIAEENLLSRQEFSKVIHGKQTINDQVFKKEGTIKSIRYLKNCVSDNRKIENATVLLLEETYMLTGNAGNSTEIKNHYLISYDADKLIDILNFHSLRTGNMLVTGQGAKRKLLTERKTPVETSLKIVPVPASDKITVITANDDSQSAFISIYDVNSRLIKKVAVTDPLNTEIDVASMPNGVYYLNYASKNFEQSSQFVILK